MIERFRSIYGRLTAGGSTSEQAVQSGVWVAGINVSDRLLQLLKVVILARLLSPDAFGLLGIALLTITAMRQFSKLGFDEALIQHEEEDVDAYLDTAWIMKIGRGVAIAAVAFLAAPFLADFFDEPRTEALVRVIGLSPLILGLQNPAVVYFQKNLNFHREFFYQVGSRAIDLLVAVAIALVFRSVWALVAGRIAMDLAKLLLSYVIHAYRPSLGFNGGYAREMFAFGKWMFASSILVFLYGQGDDVFVGWFFTAGSLGIYQLAYRFSNAPATEVTHVISRVAFPAFAKVQDDTAKLREGFLRSVQLSTTIAFPMAAGIAAVAPQFVPVVLGSHWRPAIPVMQILALWGGIRAFGANVGSVYKSTGHPDLEAKIQAFKALVMFLTIYPAAKWFGVIGVAYIIVLNSFLVIPVHLFIISSMIDERISRIVSVVGYPLTGSTIMAIGVLTLDQYALPGTSIGNLLLAIGFGVLCYLAMMVLFERYLGGSSLEMYYAVRDNI